MKRSFFMKLLAGSFLFTLKPYLVKGGDGLKKGTSFKEKLIDCLRKAFADEWLAYYQYYVEYSEVNGNLKDKAIVELKEHAEDELRHAGMLRDRIHELGGHILLSPEDWYKYTNCGYLKPRSFDVGHILEDAIEGERCAIKVYTKIANMTKGKDEKTYKIVTQILKEEQEHEEDLLKVKALLKK